MKVLFYSTKKFEKPFLEAANRQHFELVYKTAPLSAETVQMAEGFDAVSIFTSDDASAPVLTQLKELDISLIAVRAAGYDNVDLKAAAKLCIQVSNVPDYSPNAIAEHAVAMLMALNRKLIVANEQVHQQNFTVDKLVGFDLKGKTVGIVGTGKIGAVFARIMHGFGCRLLAYDLEKDETLVHRYNVRYTELYTLCEESDVISLHLPLNAKTKYMFASPLFQKMKKGVLFINTARGAVVNSADLLTFLEKEHIGAYGMDVYENEKGLFFYDHSSRKMEDAVLMRFLNRKNVLLTPHQAFATVEAITSIAQTTFENMIAWANFGESGNELVDTTIRNSEKVG